MPKGFTLSILPWVYTAKYRENGSWDESYIEKSHKTPKEEDSMEELELAALRGQRNSFPELPLVNYTTQYGLGCFEGLKAFPQQDGSLKLFRPDANARRMADSMKGLLMPPFPEGTFVEAVKEVVRKNKELGFTVQYDPEWEKNDFTGGHAVYIRPFSYAEPGVGLGTSNYPWVVIVTTPVGAYFKPGSKAAVTTDKVRATPNGTGWIKCDANYVIPILAKKEAESAGYMEAIFLDSVERKYVEEGSSCNIFFLMKDGTLTTPALEDTILPGINRDSVLTIARDMGIPVEERKITIDEVLDNAKECFVTGTAAGVAYIESITHNGGTTVFNNRKEGDTTKALHKTLKGIQYGAVKDTYGWLFPIE